MRKRDSATLSVEYSARVAIFCASILQRVRVEESPPGTYLIAGDDTFIVDNHAHEAPVGQYVEGPAVLPPIHKGGDPT